MEKHDEISELMNGFKALTIDAGDTEAILEDSYKKFTDCKLIFYSLPPSQFTHDEYQKKLDLIHSMEFMFQFYQILLNFKTVEIDTEGAEARLEDMYKEFTDLKSRFNSLPLKGLYSHVQELLDSVHVIELKFQFYQLHFALWNDFEALAIAGCDIAKVKELLKEFKDLKLTFNSLNEYQEVIDRLYKYKSKLTLMLVKVKQEV